MAPANPYLKSLPASNPLKASPSVKPGRATPTTATSTDIKLAAKAATEDKARIQATLRAEILALGGDEEDLKLIQDVDSDSEVEGEDTTALLPAVKGKKGKQDEASLAKDLKDLFKSLDFAAAGAAAPLLDDDEDDEVNEQEDESESEESEEDDDQVEDDEESVSEEEVLAQVVVEAPVESKRAREDRRKEEREVLKAQEKSERAIVREEKSLVKMPVVKSVWIVDPTPQWYAVTLPTLTGSTSRPAAALLTTLQTQATTLLARENTLYATSLAPRAPASAPAAPNGLSKADQVFIQQILTSGTSSDKLSALLLLVSSSPLHTMAYLDQIIVICKKKSREESGRAIRGVVEWWRGGGGDGGGSPSRKLKAFADQPGLAALGQAWEASAKGKAAVTDLTQAEMERCLVIWAFEDWLKKWFFQVLQALEQMSVDPLPHPRTLAVVHLSNLLRDKPEQEGNILRLLVNKLGDSQRNIASKTSHHLLQILQFHPGMTPILVREVSSLILRPAPVAAPAPGSAHVRFGAKGQVAKEKPQDNGQDHARYYGVITLNQVMLTRSQAQVAGKMIEVYFEIFGDLLGRVADEEAAATLEGGEVEVKKPFIKKKPAKGKREDDNAPAEGEVSENDSKLVAAVLTGVNRAFPFAKLDDDAFKKRLDTLFRITHTGTFNVSIQALMLIYHVSAAKRAVSDRFYRALYTSLFDARLAGSSKQALYLNLVFKAVKQDTETQRVCAFVKRLVQVMLGMDVTFILGSIWIVGELMATIKGLRVMLDEPEGQRALPSTATATDPSARPDDATAPYDGKKREPQFAHAQNSCLWELVPLLEHYHPSVVLHAEQLLAGLPVSAADDLEQHSLNHFLDRFVYRDVKKHIPTKGSSMMQSGVPGQDGSGRIVMKKGPARGQDAMVNSDLFRNKAAGDIPVDQLFFHKYFSSKTAQSEDKSKASKKRKNRKTREGESSDEESIGDLGQSDEEGEDTLPLVMDDDDEDDEAEAEIWKAMKASMPKKADDDLDEDDDDSDDDSDLDQFDYSDSDEEAAAPIDADEDGTFESAFGKEEDELDDGDDGDNLMEDDGDVFGSDEDVPMFGDEDEDAQAASGASKSKSRSQEQKSKKRKLKHLPTFATADDYAHMLGGSDDEDA